MISVCIATYNGVEELPRQLDSIIAQLHTGDEIVVSDDHSTDGTRELLATYPSEILRVVDGPAKGSPIPNFENALRNAKGDYIFLADQDDQWLPGKVEAFLRALRQYDCVVSDSYVTDADLRVLSPSFYALNHTRRGRFYNLLVKNGYLGCCMAFRRSVLERAMPFPSDIPMHDIWIGNVAAFTGRVAFIPDRLINFCRHDHNASSTARRSRASLICKIGYRWTVVKHLLSLPYRKR